MQVALAELTAARGADQIQVADFTFFETLVVASGNRVLRLMLTAIRAAYAQNRSQFAVLYPDDQMITVLHELTVAAVAQSDSEAAAQAMKAYAQTALVVFEND
jgi:DNA-binding FadR family transcriptional regulator